jgi:dTDP-4-dehydrorhamnose 3,5-epimerase
MVFTQTRIEGAYIVDPQRIEDDRGFFARAWCKKEFAEHNLKTQIAQVNAGFSPRKGTIRGMHYQRAPHEEVKICRCVMGAIYDVLTDLRPHSATYKEWLAVELTPENGRMLYIPEGCAHGYQTLVDNSELWYFTSQFYAPGYATGVRYNDPVFAIEWPLPVQVISDADRSWPDYGQS